MVGNPLSESKLESETGAIKWWTYAENMSFLAAFEQALSGVTALGDAKQMADKRGIEYRNRK